MPTPPPPNLAWAKALLQQVRAAGVEGVVLSPGSRSTPLTVAVAEDEDLDKIIHFDERGAAYHALGIAKGSGTPVALVCTSGTAAANYLPAVTEAFQDQVPLVILTADRPSELVDVGANQTIDQRQIYGRFVKAAVDLTPPEPGVSPRTWLKKAATVLDEVRRSPRGPVHINVRFREPLLEADVEDLQPENIPKQPPKSREDGTIPYGEIADSLSSLRGILIAGRNLTATDGEAILSLAERLNWPVLPDIQSQLRLREHDHIIHFADLILANTAGLNAAEVVLHLGGPYLSKRLLTWIGEGEFKNYFHVEPSGRTLDPSGRVTQRIVATVASFCENLVKEPIHPAPGSWPSEWRQASDRVSTLLETVLSPAAGNSEPMFARALAEWIPEDHALFLSSSLPIRHFDSFAAPRPAAPAVFANRGVSGIDGIIATAAGVARGRKSGTTVFIGDLAALHDLNSLALLQDQAYPFVLVLLNNDGGGIFHLLPIAGETDVFEPYFGTPHGLQFKSAAEMFDLPYRACATFNDFHSAYTGACGQPKTTIIELKTDRRQTAGQIRDILSRIQHNQGE